MIDVEKITSKNIIFDLDGTLIDSAPAILDSLTKALKDCGITPVCPLAPTLIGPPLMEILEKLSGTKSKEVLNSLAEAFKAHYDLTGYKDTLVFPGVSEALSQLKKSNHQLFIATNKRLFPTINIIKYLDWSSYFTEIFSLDSTTPNSGNKAHLLYKIICKYNLNSHNTLYIGDRADDEKAAASNNLPFIMATWGYNK